MFQVAGSTLMRYIQLHEFKPGLTTTMIPPSSYLEKTNGTLAQDSCVLRIDDDGFMVTEKPEDPSATKILFLGGSSVENLYIIDERRVASRVETILAASGKNTKCYSAGVSNANLLHLVNILLNKGLALQPKYIVFLVTMWPDLLANDLEKSFWNPMISPIRTQGKESEVNFREVFFNSRYNANQLIDERRLLRILCDVAANYETPLFMGNWPIPKYDEPTQKLYPNKDVFDAQTAQGHALNQAVREVCVEKSVPLIDLQKELEHLEHAQYFYDLAHPNAAGCEKLAEIISEALRRRL